MGTRSHTNIIEKFKDTRTGKQSQVLLVSIYRQYDGYPSGMGKDLAEWLSKVKVVNGLSGGYPDGVIVCNGAGCLAAQLIKELKDGAGNIYITKPNPNNAGVNYTYDIVVDFDTHEVTLKAYDVDGYYNKKKEYCARRKKIYEGSAADFINVYLKKEEQEA